MILTVEKELTEVVHFRVKIPQRWTEVQLTQQDISQKIHHDQWHAQAAEVERAEAVEVTAVLECRVLPVDELRDTSQQSCGRVRKS